MPASDETRTSTQRVWLAGAAALVTILLVGGGWLVWHGLDLPQATLRPAPETPEPSGFSSEVVAFGAPELVDGVPWGFPLTPHGAAAAAVTAVAATGQPEVVFDPDRFAQVAAVVFTPEEATAQARQVEAARTEFELSEWGRQPASRRLYFFAPVAVRLVAYDPDPPPAARVEVWAMTLVGVGDAGGAVFTTSTVDLEADGGTWRVAGVDTVEGPTPLVHAHATAPGRTRGLLREAVATWPLPLPAEERP
jgi:hypothetical protein